MSTLSISSGGYTYYVGYLKDVGTLDLKYGLDTPTDITCVTGSIVALVLNASSTGNITATGCTYVDISDMGIKALAILVTEETASISIAT